MWASISKTGNTYFASKRRVRRRSMDEGKIKKFRALRKRRGSAGKKEDLFPRKGEAR